MARVLRFELPGEVFHIISRCSRDGWILDQGDPRRTAFRRSLVVAQERSDCRVLAYASMSNHLHLVVLAGEDPLGLFMKRFLGGLAWRINRRLEGSGAVVGGRFKALLVEKEAYLCQLIAYVHANPVRAGVAASVWDGSWTSARAYLGEGDPAAQAATACDILSTSLSNLRHEIDLRTPESLQRNPAFAMDSVPDLERQRLARERSTGRKVMRTGPFLGGSSLRARLRQRVPGLTGTIETPDGLAAGVVEDPSVEPTLDALLDSVLRDCGCVDWTPPRRGRPPRGLRLARWLALTLGRELYGRPVDDVAPRLRITREAATRLLAGPPPPGAVQRCTLLREGKRWGTEMAATLNSRCDLE